MTPCIYNCSVHCVLGFVTKPCPAAIVTPRVVAAPKPARGTCKQPTPPVVQPTPEQIAAQEQFRRWQARGWLGVPKPLRVRVRWPIYFAELMPSQIGQDFNWRELRHWFNSLKLLRVHIMIYVAKMPGCGCLERLKSWCSEQDYSHKIRCGTGLWKSLWIALAY